MLCLKCCRPQNQFTSGLTGNNLIAMPKKELSLQDIVTSVTECSLDTEKYARQEIQS